MVTAQRCNQESSICLGVSLFLVYDNEIIEYRAFTATNTADIWADSYADNFPRKLVEDIDDF